MDSDENLDDSLEREGQDSDVHSDVGKLVDERNTPEENTSAPEIIAFIPPPDFSNLKQPACSGSKDYHHSMSNSSAERAFATLIENLSPHATNLGGVMQFIAAVCKNLDWALLKILSDTMTEFVKFDPITKPSGCRVNVADIEINVRCQVPDDMLRSGWEPLKVRGDGNCLFRSLSVSITDHQCECLYQWLKLWCIVHGCLNEHFYIKQFLADADRVDGFLSMITDDGIYGGIGENKTMKEKVSYVYQREIMKTSVDGRYSAINTFSENFDTVCAGSSKCQFVHDLDSAARERWILCEHCLLWFHESCVYYAKGRSLPSRWFCGCMKQPECIWNEDFDDPVKLRRFFVSSPNAELKLFLKSLASKEVKSRRVFSWKALLAIRMLKFF